MNGYEATKKINSIRPNLPIIAHTAYSTTSEKEKAFLNGCVDFISKPVVENQLYEKIEKHLKKKEFLANYPLEIIHH